MNSRTPLALFLTAALAFLGQITAAHATNLKPEAFNGRYSQWDFQVVSTPNTVVDVKNNILQLTVNEGPRTKNYTFDLNNQGEQEIVGLTQEMVKNNGFGAKLLKSITLSNFAVASNGKQLNFDANWYISYTNPIGGKVDLKVRANAMIRSSICHNPQTNLSRICLKTRISNIEVANLETELSPDSQKAVAIALDLSLKLLGGGINLFPEVIYNTQALK